MDGAFLDSVLDVGANPVFDISIYLFTEQCHAHLGTFAPAFQSCIYRRVGSAHHQYFLTNKRPGLLVIVQHLGQFLARYLHQVGQVIKAGC